MEKLEAMKKQSEANSAEPPKILKVNALSTPEEIMKIQK